MQRKWQLHKRDRDCKDWFSQAWKEQPGPLVEQLEERQIVPWEQPHSWGAQDVAEDLLPIPADQPGIHHLTDTVMG